MTGVRINELPKFLTEDLKKKLAIIFDDMLNPNGLLIIPIALKEFTSYFPSRKKKASEYEDESIPNIDMKSEAPVWEPYKTRFAEQEDAMTNLIREVIISETITRGRWIINPVSTNEDDAMDFTDDFLYIMRLTLRSMWLGLNFLREEM